MDVQNTKSTVGALLALTVKEGTEIKSIGRAVSRYFFPLLFVLINFVNTSSSGAKSLTFLLR